MGDASVPALISVDELHAQAPFFMKYAAEVVQRVNAQGHTSGIANQITKLWRALVVATTSIAFTARMRGFMKLGQIAIVMVGGSVEDERVFSAMIFVGRAPRTVCAFASQSLFTLQTFPPGPSQSGGRRPSAADATPRCSLEHVIWDT